MQPGFGFELQKLEHAFRYEASVVEFQATYGNDGGFTAIKSEIGFTAGNYDFSKTQFYFSRPMGNRMSSIVGLQHLDLDVDNTTSLMFGTTASLAFDVDVLALVFIDKDFMEGRLELARTFELSPRVDVEPNIDLRSYSNDAESVALELRLGYAATDRLKTYLDVFWFRVEM